jgi:hypothetical protein
MNANKIIVPSKVADAIAHYVALADTKTEALQDILRFGYEAERSEIILRHFEHDYDELMEALICGYEVEKTPEERMREYFKASVELKAEVKDIEQYQFCFGKVVGIHSTLDILGIKIDGINGVND